MLKSSKIICTLIQSHFHSAIKFLEFLFLPISLVFYFITNTVIKTFRLKKEKYFCLLCRTTFEKRVNGKTIFLPIKEEPQVDVQFAPDFEV